MNRILEKLPVETADKSPGRPLSRGALTFLPPYQRLCLRFIFFFIFLTEIGATSTSLPRTLTPRKHQGSPGAVSSTFSGLKVRPDSRINSVIRSRYSRICSSLSANTMMSSNIWHTKSFSLQPGVQFHQIYIAKKADSGIPAMAPFSHKQSFRQNRPGIQKQPAAEGRLLRILSENILQHRQKPVYRDRIKVIVNIHFAAVPLLTAQPFSKWRIP